MRFLHRVFRKRFVRSRLAHNRFIAVRHKAAAERVVAVRGVLSDKGSAVDLDITCLLYTSDAADD